ncbi:hypothetical protein C8R44DRAFT_814982 [Mycena epipterygia]|nr:hypothetical protein C8R44DRAFT_814982 [Mycena epipterygia]
MRFPLRLRQARFFLLRSSLDRKQDHENACKSRAPHAAQSQEYRASHPQAQRPECHYVIRILSAPPHWRKLRPEARSLLPIELHLKRYTPIFAITPEMDPAVALFASTVPCGLYALRRTSRTLCGSRLRPESGTLRDPDLIAPPVLS